MLSSELHNLVYQFSPKPHHCNQLLYQRLFLFLHRKFLCTGFFIDQGPSCLSAATSMLAVICKSVLSFISYLVASTKKHDKKFPALLGEGLLIIVDCLLSHNLFLCMNKLQMI